jgi:malyl-CoA/(S)-citramalyl-CoA lyase
VPFTPSRRIHFFDPSNEKITAKLPEIAKKTDILLGILEDAVPVDRKEAAREGLLSARRPTSARPPLDARARAREPLGTG